VISSSPTDVQPVFDAIVETGARLCEADFGLLARYDGTSMAIVAHSGATNEEIETALRAFPRGPTPDSLGGRAILEQAVIHIPDVRSDPRYGLRVVQDAGWRTGLGVPLLRECVAIGVVGMWRRDVRPFSDRQIELLKVFADQAVIAIENVRLFNETKEALEQQTATSEILRVISASPTDLHPVFDAIAESAARLCEAFDANIFSRDGDRLLLVAHHGSIPTLGPVGEATHPLVRGTTAGRAMLDGQAVHVADIQTEVDEFPESSALGRQLGIRTLLSIPLMREGVAHGAISLRRTEARLFTDRQVALLQTFADQAVIAIENVRLFTELQASNRELTTALDTQTATSDILRVISRSQTDVQPVFDAILASAVRLLGANSGGLTLLANDQLVLAALTSIDDAGDAAQRTRYPQPLHSEDPHAQAIRNRAPLNIADAQTDPRLDKTAHVAAHARGFRGLVAVPMLRHDEAIGAITVSRREPGGFTDDEIALLQTFADQAVIAIENVRLFNETKEALERQTATGDILRVIANSPTDAQPVFEAIVQSAMRLCDGTMSVVSRYDGELIHLAAYNHVSAEAVELMRQVFPIHPTRSGTFGRVVLERGVVHIPDVWADAEFNQSISQAFHSRSTLGVPMLLDGKSGRCDCSGSAGSSSVY
jgi:two-component system, NtrC family, sensor kinase